MYRRTADPQPWVVFLLEQEYNRRRLGVTVGLRHEWQIIDAERSQRTPIKRETSVICRAVWTFAPQYFAGFSLSRSSACPLQEELYGLRPLASRNVSWQFGLGRENVPQMRADLAQSSPTHHLQAQPVPANRVD